MKKFAQIATLLLASLVLVLPEPGPVWAQGSASKNKPRTPPSPASIRTLDIQAEKLEGEFLKGLTDLAKSYEDAGDLQKTSETLKLILKLRPDAEPVKNKLKEIEEYVFENNEVTFEVDSSRNWSSVGVFVGKGKPVRIEAAGSFKFIINEELGPEGFKDDNVVQDQVASFPSGALIGMVAPIQASGGNAGRGKPKDTPEPFLIGKELELTPKEDGILYMKMNVPAGSKCIGKIKVKLSGNFRKVGG